VREEGLEQGLLPEIFSPDGSNTAGKLASLHQEFLLIIKECSQSLRQKIFL